MFFLFEIVIFRVTVKRKKQNFKNLFVCIKLLFFKFDIFNVFITVTDSSKGNYKPLPFYSGRNKKSITGISADSRVSTFLNNTMVRKLLVNFVICVYV